MSAGPQGAIAHAGIIGVVRLQTPFPLSAASALVAGGISLIEVTLTTPGAIDTIASLTTIIPRCIPGAGTVLDAGDAQRVIDAGARFVVTPVFSADVVAVCKERGVLCIAGALTPTEMLHAARSGAEFVKVFPSAQLGPGYFRDVLAPMPFLKLVPSGGVSLANAGDWIKAGAAAVSVGTSLINADSVRDGAMEALTVEARALFDAVAAAREERAAK